MQNVKIPITIDPIRTAQKRLNFEGIVPFASLPRFGESVLSADGDVIVAVECGTDQQGLVYFQGHAAITVQLRCERCGDAMAHHVHANFAYTPIKSQDADLDDIPERYDVVELDEHGEVNLRELVEDEIILAMPLFPMHDEGQCDPAKVQMSWGEIEPEPEKPNPFAILQELKKK